MQNYAYGETAWTYAQKFVAFLWLDFIEGKLRPISMNLDILYGHLLGREQDNLKICCFSGLRSPQQQVPFVPEASI